MVGGLVGEKARGGVSFSLVSRSVLGGKKIARDGGLTWVNAQVLLK